MTRRIESSQRNAVRDRKESAAREPVPARARRAPLQFDPEDQASSQSRQKGRARTKAEPIRNAIRPTLIRRLDRPVASERPVQTPGVPPEGPLDASAPERSTARMTSTELPQEIRQRFVQVGRKYYFADGAHAFTDHGRRLTTPSENTEVIRSLIQIAEVRGWADITVTGTERFRKEAWFAARAAGLVVRGYKPTTFEQERLVRSLARQERAPAHEPSTRAAEEPPLKEARERATPESAESSHRPESRLITGRLVDYGRAPYRHDPHEQVSYFVKLETGRGERTLWGVDLERAMRESLTSPQLGDEIGVQALGQDNVVVRARERDADGRVVGEKPLDTHRNRWVVEKQGFFATRAEAAETLRDGKIRAREGVKQHPELTGTYLYLRSAEEFAKQKIRDPEDQKRFVATVRQSLAKAVAQGEPLLPVRLREAKAAKRKPDSTRKPETRKLARERE